ncbi:NUDIX domain-containing protein [Halorientalis regularis]|uniref:Translation initiation factor 2B subunit, eIF-2B alpha/beta/delta family n=1 Tax=Halorientalis regularis TaxID=660518 RepID=A0A1G7L3H0_9EURY|nr:NUDIX domain-containing protein [Halorientalis regularis]SDF43921.1 Translation initiation factor 2B subunit, eIF-2B alpha/beta/delta family [Halorientalis regularis]
MDETPVVTCFLRNRGDVLLMRRSDAVGSYTGQWGGVAGHVARESTAATDPDSTPDAAARREIDEETGLTDAVTFVRRGDPFPVEDADLNRRWLVHPYLYDCTSRDVTLDDETTECEWVPPTEILRRPTVPKLWTSYDRVRPTVETVADDRDHGAAYLSVRALEVLRDAAALAAERDAGDWTTLADRARDLLAARPSMTVVRNRVNRVMHEADDRTPTAVEDAAHEGIETALDADAAAADRAAERVAEDAIVTLSRSGTVECALSSADPERLLVAESRPGGEGVGVAERRAEIGDDVTLAPDAALPWLLADGDYDAALVGADTVLADGRVVNKVGTRALALATAREDVPLYVVAARDKISPDSDPHLEPADPATVYDGDADLAVAAPLFDVTPPDLVAGLVTEDGLLDADGVSALADEHRDLADWNAKA